MNRLLRLLPDFGRAGALTISLLGCTTAAWTQDAPLGAGAGPELKPASPSQTPSSPVRGGSPATSLPAPGSLPVPAGPAAMPAEAPCDYWIVSSRHLPAGPAPADAGALSFFHRDAGGGLTPQPREAFLG